MGTHPFASNPFVQFWIGDAEHTPDNRVAAQYLTVTDNYFNTVGIRLVRGRDFSAADHLRAPPATGYRPARLARRSAHDNVVHRSYIGRSARAPRCDPGAGRQG